MNKKKVKTRGKSHEEKVKIEDETICKEEFLLQEIVKVEENDLTTLRAKIKLETEGVKEEDATSNKRSNRSSKLEDLHLKEEHKADGSHHSAPTITTRSSRKRKENPVKIEYEIKQEEPTEDTRVNSKSPHGPKVSEKKITVKIIKANFDKINERIKKMREKRDAQVDFEVSETVPQANLPVEDQRYQFLIRVMLGTQTSGLNVVKAIHELRKVGFTMDNVLKMPHKKLADLISVVGMQQKKAEYMQRIARMVKEDFGGKVPSTMEELMQFPGVGKKIALLFMEHMEKNVQGISVDTHIHRIANRIGLVNTKNPLETSKELESLVDKKYWSGFNRTWVGFGQQICQSLAPKCNECLINDLCLEGIKRTKSKSTSTQVEKKVKVTTVKKEEITE